jgi:hypothetical protein
MMLRILQTLFRASLDFRRAPVISGQPGLPYAYREIRNPGATFYPIDITGGERGTRTLDLGIMSATL